MTPEIITICLVGGVLAGLIITTSGRLSTRLTAVEKATYRLAGLLEGLGMTGRLPRPNVDAERAKSWTGGIDG